MAPPGHAVAPLTTGRYAPPGHAVAPLTTGRYGPSRRCSGTRNHRWPVRRSPARRAIALFALVSVGAEGPGTHMPTLLAYVVSGASEGRARPCPRRPRT